jgi:tetratricopeptide (TPR) repeat protein
MKTNLDRQIRNHFNREQISPMLSNTCLSKLDDSSLSLEQQLRTDIKAKASQGEYTIAIALLNRLIALCPDNAAHYNNRGLMYFYNHQITEAFDDLSEALEIDPKLDSAYNNRANCHAANGDLAEAIVDYDLALDLNPGNIRAWINQGITLRELGMYDLALENFDIALIISDSLPAKIYAERGRTYYLHGDWNCAVADYRTALEILAQQSNRVALEHKVKDWLDRLLNPTALAEDFDFT